MCSKLMLFNKWLPDTSRSVVERHLSDKSVSRLAGVFSLVSRADLLDSLFADKIDEDVLKLTRMLRKELDRGLL